MRERGERNKFSTLRHIVEPSSDLCLAINLMIRIKDIMKITITSNTPSSTIDISASTNGPICSINHKYIKYIKTEILNAEMLILKNSFSNLLNYVCSCFITYLLQLYYTLYSLKFKVKDLKS